MFPSNDITQLWTPKVNETEPSINSTSPIISTKPFLPCGQSILIDGSVSQEVALLMKDIEEEACPKPVNRLFPASVDDLDGVVIPTKDYCSLEDVTLLPLLLPRLDHIKALYKPRLLSSRRGTQFAALAEKY